MNIEVNGILKDYWDFKLDYSNQLSLQVGDKRHYSSFNCFSKMHFDLKNERAANLLLRTETCINSQIDFDSKRSLGLIKNDLDNIIEGFKLKKQFRPEIYPFSPEKVEGILLSQSYIATIDDASDLIKKLSGFGDFIEGNIERLRDGAKYGYFCPREILQLVARNSRQQVSLSPKESDWYFPFAKLDDARFEEFKNLAVEVILNVVNPALNTWIDFLENELPNFSEYGAGLCHQPRGADYYRLLVKQETQSRLTPEELHVMGLEEVERITREMVVLSKESGFESDIDALRQSILKRNDVIQDSPEELREKIEIISMRVNRKLPAFFGNLPRMTYGVESMSPEMSLSMPPAFAQPNPVSRNNSGVHWITSIPEKAPSYTHIPIVLHESWPGHLMHIALIQENTDLPDFRRFGSFCFPAYLEGWALYSESLGVDMNMYKSVPERFGRLDLEMMRACRLVVDTGLHLYGWKRSRAIEFMKQYLSLSLVTIESEVDRYIGMPAQALSYKVGELTFKKLRSKAESKLGDDFSLRDLNDEFIRCGPCDMMMLEEYIEYWIENATCDV